MEDKTYSFSGNPIEICRFEYGGKDIVVIVTPPKVVTAQGFVDLINEESKKLIGGSIAFIEGDYWTLRIPR